MKASINPANDDVLIFPETKDEKERVLDKFRAGGDAIIIHSNNGFYLLVETLAQQSLSGSDDKSSSPKSCDTCCHKDEDSTKSPCVHCSHNYFSCHASHDF